MTSQQRTTLVVAVVIVGGLFLACGGLIVVLVLTRQPRGGTSDQTISSTVLPASNQNRFQGRTADDWGPELLDAERITSRDAAAALSNLGDESLRWFKKGLESGYQHVRSNSIAWMPYSSGDRYGDIFEPILLHLAETDPENILPAAERLSRMKSARGKEIVERKVRGIREEPLRDAVRQVLAKWGR